MGGKILPLTDSEKKLVARLEAETSWGKHGAPRARYSGGVACVLMKSLTRRRAIPDARVKWFTNPDYNIGGRGKSRKQVFERNGTRGEDIFRDPNFLKYLWYFIYGPDLPSPVIQNFKGRVASCGRVSSSDVIPLGECAKKQATDFDLDPNSAAEEFFKLALECGLDASDAGSIRGAVKRLRSSN